MNEEKLSERLPWATHQAAPWVFTAIQKLERDYDALRVENERLEREAQNLSNQLGACDRKRLGLQAELAALRQPAAEAISLVLAEMRERRVNHGKQKSPTLQAWADRIEAALRQPIADEREAFAAVKELRKRTGEGLMNCHKALKVCQGDPVAAENWLRQSGRTWKPQKPRE